MPVETIASVFGDLYGRFRRARIDTAALDARLIVQRRLGLSHADFIARPEGAVAAGDQREIDELAARREAGEPVSRLFGEREFYGLAFVVTRYTFDPRPETETLVEAALAAAGARWSGTRRRRILELGTGTGAVIVSLLVALRRAEATAVDICPGAVAAARQNALRHDVADRVSFHTGCWFEGLCGTFDMIVTNPPYLETGGIPGLACEVARHDPAIALDGGGDGLSAYRQISRAAPRYLSAGGLLLCEIGYGQKEAVVALMRAYGLRPPKDVAGTRRDLSGIERTLTFEKPATREQIVQG